MTDSYTGDVTLAGQRDTPVELTGTEDVFVTPHSVDDHLLLRNVEYVYTGPPVGDGVDPAEVRDRYAGDIEDGYLDDVAGTAVVSDAEDVFVTHDAVDGTIEADGAERVFRPDRDIDRRPRPDDTTVTGWQQSRQITSPGEGVALTGLGHDVTISDPPDRMWLYLTGYDHDVRIQDGPAEVTVHAVGRDNRISTGPYVDATVETEAGHSTTVDAEKVPVEDVIQTAKSDAYVSIGRARVTYQVGADDEQWCPNCGSDADAIVRRRYRDAVFLLGTPVYTFEEGTGGYNCEYCMPSPGDPRLSEAERRDLLR